MNTNSCKPKQHRRDHDRPHGRRSHGGPRRKRHHPRNGFFVPAIENMFNEVMNTSLKDMTGDGAPHLSKPQANIIKSDTGFTLEIALPGYAKKDVEIKLDKDSLIVSSTKTAETEANFKLREFNYGTFERRFSLNDKIDKESITATFKNGVLTIQLAHAKQEPAKTISIK